MSMMDSAADIRIYNYKTKKVHTEKGMVLFGREPVTVACLGSECEEAMTQISDMQNYALVVPISNGRIYDYTASEKLLKWMVHKYIDEAGGKRRIFKRSTKALIYLHEPCSPIEKKAYTDLMYILGYKNILMLDCSTDLGGMTPQEAIWSAEEVHGKIDCAIEIAKDDLAGYARASYEQFVNDCKRWRVDPADIIKI